MPLPGLTAMGIVLLCLGTTAHAAQKKAAAEDTLGALELSIDQMNAADSGKAAAPSGPSDSLPPITRMPELKHFVQAVYPLSLQKQGIEGTVAMDLVVTDSGRVDSVAVVSGLHPELDSAAVAAARQFVFSPAMSDTTPVPVLLRYEYHFTMQQVVEKVTEYVNLSGVLLERGTRKPVADAMVVLRFADTLADTGLGVPFAAYLKRIGGFAGQYLEEERLVTVSDSQGAFAFKSLPVGPVDVTIPVAGYEEFREREQITRAEAVKVTYYLQRVSYSDYEVVVYGKNEKKEVSRQQLTLSEVKEIPGMGGDAIKVVQALPGVARPTFGSAEIVVRGSPTSNSKFLLDGVEIPQGMLFHFGGVTSTYNADALKTVDFYPGGFGTRYGGVLGGVVEITGREPKTDRWHVYTDACLIDGTVFAEGPIGTRVSVLAELRRSFIGDVIKLVAEQYPSSSVLTVAPFYWDYILRTDINISPKQHAYVTFWGVKDATELISGAVRGGSSDIDKATNTFSDAQYFHMGIAGYDWKISDALMNTLRYSLAYVRSDMSAFGYFKTSTYYWQHYLRDQLTWTRSKELKVNLGVDAEFAPVNMNLVIPTGTGSIDKTKVDGQLYGVVGGYLNCEWRPWEQLVITPGLRLDYFPELIHGGAIVPEFWDYNFDNTSPWSVEPSLRLTTRWQFEKRHALKFALGNYTQTPQPIAQSINPKWGDPGLSASRAAQYVAGYEWQITDLISANLEGYYNRQWDVARQVSDPGLPPFDDNGKRRMYGLEVLLRHDMGKSFFGWLAYSLSHSESYDYKEKRWATADKDQTHNLTLIGSWRLPKNWGFGFRLQYTTGDPYTPIDDAIYHENSGSFQTVSGPTNSKRMDPTLQLDLLIDKKFIFRKWVASAYVGFVNINYFLYKSPQAIIPNYSYPYNPNTGEVYQTTAYQYSLPSIGIKAEF
jgi:TonB family protein